MRVWMALGFALLLSSASARADDKPLKDPEIPKAQAMATQAYVMCIVNESRRLEPSREAAETVAAGGVTACLETRARAMKVLMLNAMVNYDLKVGSAGEVAQGVLSNLEIRTKREVVLEIMEKRAAAALPM